MYEIAKEEQRMILRFTPWLIEYTMVSLSEIKDTEEKALWGRGR